jgi:hypothetical protein
MLNYGNDTGKLCNVAEHYKVISLGQVLWPTSVIPATWEVETRKIMT